MVRLPVRSAGGDAVGAPGAGGAVARFSAMAGTGSDVVILHLLRSAGVRALSVQYAADYGY